MDTFKQELGPLNHVWTNGYNGQNAYLADTGKLVYACDSIIKCVDIQSNVMRTFRPFEASPDQNTIGMLSIGKANNLIAFSDIQMPPTVYIHNLNDFGLVSKLTGGASFEYSKIEFSNGDNILTLSGVPDLQIALWKWKTGEKIIDIDLDESLLNPTFVCMSPTNWRNIVVAYETEFFFWKIEQCDDVFKASKTRFQLPSYSENSLSLVNAKNSVKSLQGNTEPLEEFYPDSAIAAIPDYIEEKLSEFLDKREKQKFQCLCWTNSDDILLVTQHNCIYKYNMNMHSASCLFRPFEETSHIWSNSDSGLQSRDLIQSGHRIKSVSLHKKGLFIVCDDGLVRLLDASQLDLDKNQHQQIKMIIDMKTKNITNIDFNSNYSVLSLATDKGIYLYDFQNESMHKKFLSAKDANDDNDTGDLHAFVDYSYGPTVAVASLNPYSDAFIVLKKNGMLQVWSIAGSKIINKIFLNMECSAFATHTHLPLCVVGTSSGHLVFVDCSGFRTKLHFLYKTKIHQKSVRKLKFNQSGTMLFSAGDDGRLYVIDMRLTDKVEYCLVDNTQMILNDYSQPRVNRDNFMHGLYVLGNTDFDGELISIDTFDHYTDESKKSIVTRVGLSLSDTANAEPLKKNAVDSANLDTQSAAVLNAEFSTILTSNSREIRFASKLMVFDISFDCFIDKKLLYNTERRLDFKDDAINKFTLLSHYTFNDFCFHTRSSIIAYVDRNICKFTMPDIESNRKVPKGTFMELNELVGTSNLPNGRLLRTANDEFIISANFDGSLVIRNANSLKSISETTGHHYTNGGFNTITHTYENTYLISTGWDNSVSIINWGLSGNNNVIHLRKKQPIEGHFDGSGIKSLDQLVSLPTNAQNEITWLEAREHELLSNPITRPR